nr:putative S-adenosyl-L-methionine-dependent methyltransferase [Ipomoea batatas]
MGRSKPVEPECMELISALAAGNRAKLMVEVTSGGPTPFTVALAVAAKQTGGRVVCIRPPSSAPRRHAEELIPDEGLRGAIEFVEGNPGEVIKKFKRVEFLVVDTVAAVGDGGEMEFWENVEVNPSGCVVVATNLLHEAGNRVWFGEMLKKGKMGGVVKCVTLPIGNGVELTKIRVLGEGKTQRVKRFHVTFENY